MPFKNSDIIIPFGMFWECCFDKSYTCKNSVVTKSPGRTTEKRKAVFQRILGQ